MNTAHARIAWLAVGACVCGQAQEAVRFFERTLTAQELAEKGGKERHAAVLRTFQQEFARIQRLEPTAAELNEVLRLMDEVGPPPSGAARPDSPEAIQRRKSIQSVFAAEIVRLAKINQFLWKKHGGRLVLSAFGTHLASDAHWAEIVELEKRGVVQFSDAGVRSELQRYLASYGGDGVVTGTRAGEVLESDRKKLNLGR